MDQGELFTVAAPDAAVGAVERALCEAARTEPMAAKYPAAVAAAQIVARAMDRADRSARTQSAGIAQLGKVYLTFLAPLGLAPELDSHPGDPLSEGGTGDGDPFGAVSRPTLVHSA